MDFRSELLNAVSNYCQVTGKSPATVATQVMNDGKFFDRIESGGGCTMHTYEKVMKWFKDNAPKPKRKDKANGHG